MSTGRAARSGDKDQLEEVLSLMWRASAGNTHDALAARLLRLAIDLDAAACPRAAEFFNGQAHEQRASSLMANALRYQG
jgi:hypothetical protein